MYVLKTWGFWGFTLLALMWRGLSNPHIGFKYGYNPLKFMGILGFYAIYGHKYQFLTAFKRLFYCFSIPIFMGIIPTNKNHLGIA